MTNDIKKLESALRTLIEAIGNGQVGAIEYAARPFRDYPNGTTRIAISINADIPSLMLPSFTDPQERNDEDDAPLRR